VTSTGPAPPWNALIAGHDGDTRRVEARWVPDATGRYSLLKRKLGLSKEVGHRADAVWFRIGHPIDIDDRSDDPAWHGRIFSRRRELSTNHLMGPGYRVWLIRLASDSIGIGIVTDPDLHPFERTNRFERALEWLRLSPTGHPGFSCHPVAGKCVPTVRSRQEVDIVCQDRLYA
jgi:flavin-dependent dehydrogenase